MLSTLSPTLCIAIFGLLGVLARFGLDRVLAPWNGNLPTSTLLVNLFGCVVAGIVVGLSERAPFSAPLQLGLIVGFCGGFTTFSAYALQSVMLLERGRMFAALSYLLLSPALGVAVLFGALVLTRRWSTL